jgi:hypothetical protein
MGMTDQEAFTILYSADERWGKFRGRLDRTRRLNDIVAIARLKHPFSSAFLQATSLTIFNFKEFMETEINIEWVIEGMLEQTGQVILSSKPGIGKTQISLRFFMALATGKRFLHYDILGTRKVIYFSLEMGHAQLKYFLKQMDESLTEEERTLLRDNFLIVPLGEALYLGNRNGQKLVEDTIEKYQPDGYCFDSLSRTTPTSVNDEEQIKAILDWDARIRNQTNTFSWYVHHNRKASIGNRKPKSLDDLLGATVIQANTSSVYTLWRQKDETFSPIEFINVKQRLGIMEPPFIINRGPHLTFIEGGLVPNETENQVSEDLSMGLAPSRSEESQPSLPGSPGMGF